MRSVLIVLTLVCASLSAFGDADASQCAGARGTVQVNPDFDCEIIDPSLPGAAFAVTGDINGDSRDDLVVSSFGTLAGTNIPTGTVAWYEHDGNGWTRHVVFDETAGIKFPNRVTVADMDSDGDADLLVPGGFFACHFGGQICGYLGWFEQTPTGWNEHVIRERGYINFFHAADAVDINNDGHLDVVTVAETVGTATAQIYPGGPDGISTNAIEIGAFGGSLPTTGDVDGDGDLDLASAQFFMPTASFAWMENESLNFEIDLDPTSLGLARVTANGWIPRFTSRTISVTDGPSIQMSHVPGVGWVGSNHTNTTDEPALPAEGVFHLEPELDPRLPWKSTRISGAMKSQPNGQGVQGAPGVFGWGDIDNDGDNDIGVSGDGDARVFLLTNNGDGTFTQTTVAGDDHLNRAQGMGQAGGGFIGDYDDDGDAEVLFTSYEQGVVALFHPNG